MEPPKTKKTNIKKYIFYGFLPSLKEYINIFKMSRFGGPFKKNKTQYKTIDNDKIWILQRSTLCKQHPPKQPN